MEKILYVVRGIPGSGKSTLAKQLTSNVYEADMYFLDQESNYVFDGTKIKNAYDWCQSMVRGDMILEYPKIVVYNTLTKEWEIQQYLELAKEFGYKVFTIIVENRHGGTNVHNVPEDKIEQMKNRFETKL